MTYRERLNRRKRLMAAMMFATIVPLLGLVFAVNALGAQRLFPLVVAVMVLSFLVINGMAIFGMRCPRCSGNFFGLIANRMPLPGIHFNYCPFCGIDLDETIPTESSEKG